MGALVGWKVKIAGKAGAGKGHGMIFGDALQGASKETEDAIVMSTIDTLRGRWAEFAELPQPEGLEAIDAGVDVELLVSTASDCIETYLATGLLSPRENGALRACSLELKRILPQVEGETADYLRCLADFVGQVMARPNLPGFFG